MTNQHHHHQLTLTVQISQAISPSVPIVHCSRLVLQATSSVRIELTSIISCRSVNTGTSMCWGPLKNVSSKFVPASPKVTRMYLFNLHGWLLRLQVSGCPSYCHVGCCIVNLFKITPGFLVWFSSNFFFVVSVHVTFSFFYPVHTHTHTHIFILYIWVYM